ncbi:MAG: HEAT repeat domain-containing protein [Planctomycetes bacterium]|nr:HEAT repeat domain-containing protein [Planctomycetota bacterium]
MTRSALLVLSLLALVAVSPAQAPYRPWLDQVLLAQTPEIVVGRLVAQSNLPSRDRLLTFEVSRRLKGEGSERVLVIGAGREILAYAELPKLLFLAARGDGYFQPIIDFVDLPDEGGRERVDFLSRYLEILRAEDATALERRLKALAFEYLPATNLWIKRIAVRELHELARTRPAIFDAKEMLELRDFDLGSLPPREQAFLREASQLVEEGKALGWTRGSLVFPDEETRRAFLADLARFERGGDPVERIRFLDDASEVFGRRFAPYLALLLATESGEVLRHACKLLGDMESGAGLGRLEALVRDGEAEVATRQAAVVAIGKIAAMRSVPLLVAATEQSGLLREALVALVAVNTAEAALAVRDYEEKLRKDPEADPELRRFLVRIRSDAFQKTLADERAARRKRWQR